MVKQTSMRLDAELLKTVKKLCVDKNISLKDGVTEALKEWVEKESEKNTA